VANEKAARTRLGDLGLLTSASLRVEFHGPPSVWPSSPAT
jgi:hypothetical protein